MLYYINLEQLIGYSVILLHLTTCLYKNCTLVYQGHDFYCMSLFMILHQGMHLVFLLQYVHLYVRCVKAINMLSNVQELPNIRKKLHKNTTEHLYAVLLQSILCIQHTY